MDIFTALAEPTRRDILEMLAVGKELSATDIYQKFKASPPAISQHLKVLREAKLVSVERRAQQRIYHLNPEPMRQLEMWLKRFTQQWDERFDKLDAILENGKKRLKAEKGEK